MNFSSNKKSGDSKSPKNKGTKSLLLASRRISNLTNSYIGSESARKEVVKAVLAKRPRSYGEINAPMKKYSYLFSYFAHFCSIVLALPFIAHFLGLFLSLIGYTTPPATLCYIIASALLFVFEVGQSKTLNQTFDNYYNDGEYPIEAAIVAALFSLFSITSSGYSAYYFLKDQTEFIYVGVGLSLLMESLIIYTNFFRHRYEYNTRLEAEMLNDFNHNTNSNALFETFQKTASNALPISYNQAVSTPAKIEIEEGAKSEGFNLVTPTKKELKKYGVFRQKNSPVRAEKTEEISTKKDLGSNTTKMPAKRVLTQSQTDDGKKWTESQIQNNIKSYEGKLRKFGKSFSIIANLTFFKEYKKRFKLENQVGTMPKVEAGDRKKWYEENYPEQAAKLKKADSKKRRK